MHESPCGPVLIQATRCDNLEAWQKRQNGSLNELRLEVQAGNSKSDHRIERLDERLTSLERWIMGTLAATLCGVGIAVINMLAR